MAEVEEQGLLVGHLVQDFLGVLVVPVALVVLLVQLVH
jgi:hypothetical protein